MENGGSSRGSHGVPSWTNWDHTNYAAAASPPFSLLPSSSTPSHSFSFPDHPLVPSMPAHLTCLKLGKRHYYGHEDTTSPMMTMMMKKERLSTSSSSPVPRCQVEECEKLLGDAKDYHRRHKVCEAHSKAPRVVVMGVEQRFCQQCSRFHGVSEFDGAKRSCRRRLAGHNERRRKNSSNGGMGIENGIMRNVAPSLESTVMGSRFPYHSYSGRALSLLSSEASTWGSASDLSSRSSAALHELIQENRAAVLSRQLFFERNGWHGSANKWLE